MVDLNRLNLPFIIFHANRKYEQAVTSDNKQKSSFEQLSTINYSEPVAVKCPA